MTDDILRRIDATLETLFPPDDTLTEEQIDRLLDDDGEAAPAPVDGHRPLQGVDLVYGLFSPEVVFVGRSTAEWIDAALPRVAAGELDWESDIPWVQRDQEDLLPDAVVERFGTYESSALDGPVVSFRDEDTAAIVEWLEQLGATCTRDDDLVGRACFG